MAHRGFPHRQTVRRNCSDAQPALSRRTGFPDSSRNRPGPESRCRSVRACARRCYGRGAPLRDSTVCARLLPAWANRKPRQHDLRRIADPCRQRSKRRNRGGDSRPRARSLQPGDERNSGRNSAPLQFRAAETQIARLLETQYREKPPETRRPRAAMIAGAIAAVLLLGWAGYSTYLLIEWSRFLSELRKQPGIVVVSYTKDGRTFHIQGFRDPLSDDPKKLI